MGEAPELTLGQRVADVVATRMGSWSFIIVQSVLLVGWVSANVVHQLGAWHWDEYPFVFLNLALSFQAAYAAPIIMMAQNRQQDIDRQKAALAYDAVLADYNTDLRLTVAIELLHSKLDELRTREVLDLLHIVHDLVEELHPSARWEDPEEI